MGAGAASDVSVSVSVGSELLVGSTSFVGFLQIPSPSVRLVVMID